jgi:anti-sigma regulatory factor (Ser/Thr protein kinase)
VPAAGASPPQGGSAGPPRQRFAVAPDAFRLGRARRRVRDYLTLYCRDRLCVDDAVLCVHEACANAVRHSGSRAEIEVFLGFRDGDLQIVVRDGGRGFDTSRFDPRARPDLLNERGWGLFLMSRLADEVELHAGGSFEVRLVRRGVLDTSDGAGEPSAARGVDAPPVAHYADAPPAAHDADARFAALVDSLAEGVAVHELVERDGEVVDYRTLYVNAAFERQSGLAAGQVCGRLAGELSASGRAPRLDEYAWVVASGEPFDFETWVEETKRHLLVRAVALGGSRFATVSDDATERRRADHDPRAGDDEPRRLEAPAAELARAEPVAATTPPSDGPRGGGEAQELAERVRLGEELAAIDRLLRSALDGDEMMQRALDAGVAALAADAGVVELRDETVWVVRCQSGIGPAVVGVRQEPRQAPNALRALRYREPFATADMLAARTGVGFVAEQGLRAVLAVPLLAHDEVIGCLSFYARQVRVFDDPEIDFGRKLGVTLALAMDNARLRGEPRDS